MTEQYFRENVAKCNECGCTPRMEKVTRGIIAAKNDGVKYRVVCPDCEYENGSINTNKTGLCKTPENAMKAWNKKMK